MSPLLLGSAFSIGKELLDRFFPDPAERARAQMELLRMEQEGEFKQMDAVVQLSLAQARVNEVEAASDGLFKSGWRPAVGWVCVAAFVYAALLRPLLPWTCALFGHQVPELPPIEDVFTELLFGMLGLGTLRTAEKWKSIKKTVVVP